MPFSPMILLALIFFLGMFIAFIQLGILTIAFDKLGLSPSSAISLLIVSLMGSIINLPLFKIDAEAPVQAIKDRIPRLLRQVMPPFTGKTTIAINVGGGLIPISFSLYLTLNNPLPVSDLLFAITLVSTISYLVSRPISGLGIGIPILVAPLTAAIAALLLNPDQSAPLAYIGGTLGVLIGADVLRMNDIRKMGTPIASIGGAGTFDGIFITGIVAVILA